MIDIGGGTIPAPGHINLDPVHGQGVWKRRVEDGIPAADKSVDAVRASHVMEHVCAGEDRIFVFNEVHRVLRSSGVFHVIVPRVMPTNTWHAFADPTHVSFWVIESFHYFDGTFGAHADYGILPWKTLELRTGGDCDIIWRGTPK